MNIKWQISLRADNENNPLDNLEGLVENYTNNVNIQDRKSFLHSTLGGANIEKVSEADSKQFVTIDSSSTSVIWKHDLFIKCEAFTDEHTKLESDNIEDPMNNSTSSTSMNQGSPLLKT